MGLDITSFTCLEPLNLLGVLDIQADEYSR